MTTTFRNAQAAFADAIESGRLIGDEYSLTERDARTPGNWACFFMYMGTMDGRDLFEHIGTREHLP